MRLIFFPMIVLFFNSCLLFIASVQKPFYQKPTDHFKEISFEYRDDNSRHIFKAISECRYRVYWTAGLSNWTAEAIAKPERFLFKVNETTSLLMDNDFCSLNFKDTPLIFQIEENIQETKVELLSARNNPRSGCRFPYVTNKIYDFHLQRKNLNEPPSPNTFSNNVTSEKHQKSQIFALDVFVITKDTWKDKKFLKDIFDEKNNEPFAKSIYQFKDFYNEFNSLSYNSYMNQKKYGKLTNGNWHIDNPSGIPYLILKNKEDEPTPFKLDIEISFFHYKDKKIKPGEIIFDPQTNEIYGLVSKFGSLSKCL